MFSMSKTYGMAGWRLGFVVGNAEIVARLDLLADHVRVGIFAPVQHAGIAALTGPQDSVAERVETYRRRRERVRELLPDLECEGSFYLWWELPEGLTPELLLAEHRVAVAPGEGFGSRGAGWARLSLAVTDEVLETGLERLERAALSALALAPDPVPVAVEVMWVRISHVPADLEVAKRDVSAIQIWGRRCECRPSDRTGDSFHLAAVEVGRAAAAAVRLQPFDTSTA